MSVCYSGTGIRTPMGRSKDGRPAVRRCRRKLGWKESNFHSWAQNPVACRLADAPVKREEGVEPSSSVWKTDALAVELRPRVDGVRIELTGVPKDAAVTARWTTIGFVPSKCGS